MNKFRLLTSRVTALSLALTLIALMVISPKLALAATFQGGNLYVVSNTEAPAWMDPVQANIGDVVQFKVNIVNNGPETATNVRVRATFPTGVSGSSVASTITVVADNAPAVSDNATVNTTDGGTTKSLVYFPGHAFLVTNSGSTSLEAIGSGSEVNIGSIQAGAGNYVEVTFKARLTEQAVATPSPTATPTPSPTATPTPTPAQGAVSTVTCPDGKQVTISPGQSVNIVCQAQSQQQTQNNNQTVNVTAAAAPTPAPAVAGAKITQLPKTGLPLLAWAAAGFIPAGFGLKKFGKVVKDNAQDSPNYLWEERKYKKV